MNLPKDRNDRVMLGTLAGLVGLGLGGRAQQRHRQWPGVRAPLRRLHVPRSSAHSPHAARCRMRTPRPKVTKSDGPVSIVRDPTDLPAPMGKRGPQRVKVDLETIEMTGKLADGATYHYWTFNQKVPGHLSACASATGGGAAEKP